MKNQDKIKNVAGIRRKEHFANGGDVASWRGRARRFADEKKQVNKMECRRNYTKDMNHD